MPHTHDAMKVYQNPLLQRYASRDMAGIFSPHFKFSTWRRLWIALARCEKDLGLNISDTQIAQMQEHVDDIDYALAARYEKELRHDVMAHVHAFGDVCPQAKPIIHLGATSAYVGDNTDLIQMKQGGRLILQRLAALITALRTFALEHKDLATLGYTHFQSAQLVTVGKRACLWMYELSLDFYALRRFIDELPFLGVKGTTGTQASFLHLFDGNHETVKNLDDMVAREMGFSTTQPVAGQTYTRKFDSLCVGCLSGIAQSLHKIANDIRLLAHLKEIEEPFEKNQIGSSAMAYKRNPMRSERMTSLCRYVMSLATSPAMTAAEQWFERTLDDSANKRLAIPEAFLAIDAALIIAHNVCAGLVVYPRVIDRRITDELPFMATENIIMESVKRGGDRQQLHERIRIHSMEAVRRVKMEGLPNDLLERILADADFGLNANDLSRILDVRHFVGRAPEQTVEFIASHIDPLLAVAAEYGEADATELCV